MARSTAAHKYLNNSLSVFLINATITSVHIATLQGDCYITADNEVVCWWNMTVSQVNSRYHVFALDSVQFGRSWDANFSPITVVEAILDSTPRFPPSYVYSSTSSSSDSSQWQIDGAFYAYTGRTRWVNDNERSIVVLEDYGTVGDRFQDRYKDLTDLQVMNLICEYWNLGNTVGDTDWLGSSYDPFTLITNALNTATSFMGIAILPGLTIGILFTIPLLITLIIVVFKLIKK